MILKVVLLTSKELINLSEPRGIHRLGLRTVIAVMLITKSSVGVIGVLGGIDVEVLLLVIVNSKKISLGVVTVLSKESLHGGSIHLSSLGVEESLIAITEEDGPNEFPSPSVISYSRSSHGSLETENQGGE